MSKAVFFTAEMSVVLLFCAISSVARYANLEVLNVF